MANSDDDDFERNRGRNSRDDDDYDRGRRGRDRDDDYDRPRRRDDDYDDFDRRGGRGRGGYQDTDLTALEWILCILCSGIGCIVGIVYLCQGNPKGGKMIGFSLLFAVIWNVITFAITGGKGFQNLN